MCRHLPDNRSGRLANFVRQAEFLVEESMLHRQFYVRHTVWSGILKKLPDLPKFCPVCLAGPALNDNTAFIFFFFTAGGGDPRFNKQLAKVVDIGLTQGLTKTRINEMVEKCVCICMPPTSKKLQEHIGFGLSVRPCVHPSVCQKPCMLGFWNFIYAFLMEKYLTHIFFLSELSPFLELWPFEKIIEIWCMPYLVNRAC